MMQYMYDNREGLMAKWRRLRCWQTVCQGLIIASGIWQSNYYHQKTIVTNSRAVVSHNTSGCVVSQL